MDTLELARWQFAITTILRAGAGDDDVRGDLLTVRHVRVTSSGA